MKKIVLLIVVVVLLAGCGVTLMEEKVQGELLSLSINKHNKLEYTMLDKDGVHYKSKQLGYQPTLVVTEEATTPEFWYTLYYKEVDGKKKYDKKGIPSTTTPEIRVNRATYAKMYGESSLDILGE